MYPLGTKVYLLKRYCPSDSFCTFFSESDQIATSADIVQGGNNMPYVHNCVNDI